MSRFNDHRTAENHLFIVTSLVPAALFVATLLAAVHVSKLDRIGPETISIGYTVPAYATA